MVWTLNFGLLSVLAGLVDGSFDDFFDECGCDQEGTKSRTFQHPAHGEQTIYECDETTKKCTCKENYGGDKCQNIVCSETVTGGRKTRVDCSLTVDNEVVEIFYNNTKLTVKGDLNDWRKEKTITFENCDGRYPGKLTIKGKDLETGNQNCVTAGLLLHCVASDKTSPWHNFVSAQDHWKDSKGEKPCQNNGGMYSLDFSVTTKLKTLGAKKIWAPRQQVKLIGEPEGMYFRTHFSELYMLTF